MGDKKNLTLAEREREYYLDMESKEFGLDLTRSFEAWNRGRDMVANTAKLQTAIEFASKNGIELTLTIPKALLDSKSVVKPIDRGDAIEHSTGTSEHTVLFDIPSETGMNKIGASKKLILKAVDSYRDLGTVLLLEHKTKGVIGVFIPGEISSLGVK